MRIIAVVIMAAMLSGCVGTIGAFKETVVIKNDRGGYIKKFVAKYQRWARAGKRVVVDGYCASSCTVFMKIIPRQNVCVTRRAVFGFHGAWGASLSGKVELPEQTHFMTDQYTNDINAWIESKGGLKTYKTMLLMRWPETTKYFRVC